MRERLELFLPESAPKEPARTPTRARAGERQRDAQPSEPRLDPQRAAASPGGDTLPSAAALERKTDPYADFEGLEEPLSSTPTRELPVALSVAIIVVLTAVAALLTYVLCS